MCWSSYPVNAKSATPQKPSGEHQAHRSAAALRPAANGRAAEGVSAAHTGRRVVLATNVAETSLTVPGDPLRRRPRHRPDLALQPPDQGAAAARSSRSRRPRPLSGRGGRARVARSMHPAVLRGGLRRAGRATPIPRSCGPTSPRSSCRWRRWNSATSRSFRSSIRPTRAASATVCCCCRNSAPSISTVRSPTSAVGSRGCPWTRGSGRMILAADAEGCVREVLVLAAALSIPDPRERPADREEAARQKPRPVRRRALGFRVLPQPVALST